MELIQIKKVSKSFGSLQALKEVSISIAAGETLVFVGKSGSGKTTLLKLINALVIPDSGKVFIHGEALTTDNTIEHRRSTGYVIQDVGLFPHLSVGENIVLSSRISGKKISLQRLNELLEMVGLNHDIKDRHPEELSGGQQQRVGIARALANDPSILLMDEPFSALDNLTRIQLQDDFLKLKLREKKTIVLVTHDIHEAFKLGDRIAIIDEGTIQQLGTPMQLLQQPANEIVREFLGNDQLLLQMNHLRATDLGGKTENSLFEVLNDQNRAIDDKLLMLRNFLTQIKGV